MGEEGFGEEQKRFFGASNHISHVLQVCLDHIDGLSKVLTLELDINIFINFVKIY